MEERCLIGTVKLSGQSLNRGRFDLRMASRITPSAVMEANRNKSSTIRKMLRTRYGPESGP